MWPSPCPRRTSCTYSPRSAAAGGWFSVFLYKYRYCNFVSVFNCSENQVYYSNACDLFSDSMISQMWPSPCPRRTSCTNSPRSAAAGRWFSVFLYKYRYCNFVSVFNSSENQVYHYNACELFNDLYSISLVFFRHHFYPLCCHVYSIIMLPRFLLVNDLILCLSMWIMNNDFLK